MAGENDQKEQQGLLRQAGSLVSSMYNAIMSGGQIQSAFHQGIGELGEALKAFPDSIQYHEAGTVFNPYYGDRMEARDEYSQAQPSVGPEKPEMMSPGELAQSKASVSVHGESPAPDKKPLPSAGEIAADQQAYKPEQQQQGQEHGNSQGRSM